MNRFFTQYTKILLLTLGCLFGAAGVNAQYTVTQLETGGYYSGVACDKDDNIYVVRRNTSNKYEVAKYTNGAGAPTVIYSDLTYNPSAPTTRPWGITVNNLGEVFVTNPILQWEIIKLTPGAGGTYASQMVQSGGWVSALGQGAGPALVALDYTFSPDRYNLRYLFQGQEDQMGVRYKLPITIQPGAATYPWGVVMDASLNYYVLDLHENNGGQIIRMNAPGYSTDDILASGGRYTAIAIDAGGNFYTTESNGTTYRVVKRANFTQTGEVLLDGLSTDGASLPWGLAVNSKGEVFVGDGSSPTGGRFVKLSPPQANVLVTGVTRAGANPANTGTVQYTVTFSGPVTGVTTTAFSLTTTGIAGAGVASVTPVNASTYTVTVNTGVSDGTLRLNVTGAGMSNVVTNVPFTTGETFTIDKTPPVVTSVSVPADGTYEMGRLLIFSVAFSENVILNTDNGDPYLQLTVGSRTQAAYVSSADPSVIWFTYVVEPGAMDMDGITFGSSNIILNNGTIRDAAGNNVQPALQNVPPTNGILVNTARPGVTLSTTAASQVSQPFNITVAFSEAVTGFTVGDITSTNATVSNLSTSDNITYTVQITPVADGPVTVQVAAGGVENTAGNTNTTSNTLTLSYDATAPVISSVNVPANSTYPGGSVLNFTVNFNESITVAAGQPTLPLIIGATTVQAAYTGGSGTSALSFTYTVLNGQQDANGISLGTSLTPNGATLRDAAGNNANVTLAGVGSTSLVLVDAVAPVVNSVSVPANGYYKEGDVLTFTVQMSEDTRMSGTPYLALTIGAVNVQAVYTGRTGTNALTFAYTVQPEQQDLDGIALGPNIMLNGGTVQDVAGNNAVLTLNNAGSTGNVFVYSVKPGVTVSTTTVPPVSQPFTVTIAFTEAVTGFTAAKIITGNATLSNLQTADNITYTVTVTPVTTGAVTINVPADAAVNIGNNGNTASNVLQVQYDGNAPAITAVAVPANGVYRSGDVLTFTAGFSENVNVTGTPSFDITIGSTVRKAVYSGGTSTNALTFAYMVQNGDLDMDGIMPASQLDLNSGTITDAAGNNAALALNNTGNTSNVLVNTVSPTVTLSGTPSLNAPFTLIATFSESVTGLVAADFAVTNATLSNLQTTDNITYSIVVTPVADGVVSISLPADAAVNAGANGSQASNVISYRYDSSVPTVTAVEVPANGYYKAGQALLFTVRFSENVAISTNGGSPTIPFIIGSTPVAATYTGHPEMNALTFRYTVQAGELDMDGISIGANLALNGAVIRDGAGNNAATALNNTGNTSGVFVNTLRPTVTLTTAASGRVNAAVTVTFVFSEAVNGLAAADISVANGTASNLQTADNITYTATITPAADGAVSVNLPADAAENIAGNGSDASNTISFNYDATAPVISTGQSFIINQYSPAGTEIGQVNANAGSDPLQNWAITADGSGGALEITGTGMLRVKNVNLLGPLGGTTLVLNITVTDGLNTSAPTPVTVQVTFVNKAPTLDPIANMSHCPDTETHTVQLSGASATEPGQTYTITTTASQDVFDLLTMNASNVLSYRLKAGAAPGSVTITVTIKDNGGTLNGGTDLLHRTFILTLTSPPAVNITSDKGTSVSKGETVRLTASGGAAYQWADADGIISGRQSAVLEIRPQANTTYTVTAANAAGCTVTGSISIAVVNDFKVDATNILTPNGDGRNDRWVVRNLDSYPDNEVKIFDRAGRLVYQRRNYSNTWDGTVNGAPLAEGTYYYMLTINGGAATAKGYITIVRDSK